VKDETAARVARLEGESASIASELHTRTTNHNEAMSELTSLKVRASND